MKRNSNQGALDSCPGSKKAFARKRRFLQGVFAFLGLPAALLRLARNEGRSRYARWRYPKVIFGENCSADEHCKFEEGVCVFGGTVLARASIGRNTYIGCNSVVSYCEIGRFCSIGPGVRIGLGIHPTRGVVSTYPGFYSTRKIGAKGFRDDPTIVEYRHVTIGNDVWIGANALVMDGVALGHGAIVGAGAVVTKDVEPYCIVAGVPARTIRKRLSDYEVAALLKAAWWDWDDKLIADRAHLFSRVDEFLQTMGGGASA